MLKHLLEYSFSFVIHAQKREIASQIFILFILSLSEKKMLELSVPKTKFVFCCKHFNTFYNLTDFTKVKKTPVSNPYWSEFIDK
jgi:hypothetical protein